MTDVEFIEKIKQVPLAFEEYKKADLTDDFIAQIIKGFNPSKKIEELPRYGNDEVIKLITHYDLTKTMIGMINFFEAPIVSDDRIYFGKFEIDRLFWDVLDGEIKCCEGRAGNILFRCAKNGSSFLAAIFEAACFLQKTSVNEELYDNEDVHIEVADYCTEIAGGDSYKDFYRVLLS